MTLKDNVPSAILTATAGMLQPYAPEITPTALVEALKAYNGSTPEAINSSFMTREEAAALFKVTKKTIDNWISEGVLEGRKIGKRFIRIPYASIQPLLKQSVGRA